MEIICARACASSKFLSLTPYIYYLFISKHPRKVKLVVTVRVLNDNQSPLVPTICRWFRGINIVGPSRQHMNMYQVNTGQMHVSSRKKETDDDETNTGRPASRGHFGAGSTSNTCFLDVFVQIVLGSNYVPLLLANIDTR